VVSVGGIPPVRGIRRAGSPESLGPVTSAVSTVYLDSGGFCGLNFD
jgi:hypothetical protein